MNTALDQLSKQQLIALLRKEQEAARQNQQELQEKEKAVQEYQDTVSKHQGTISKHERTITEKQDQVDYLKAQVEQYKRMLFGQKKERFEAEANQLSLPFEAPRNKSNSRKNNCWKRWSMCVKSRKPLLIKDA
jgi:transposase